MTATTKTVRGIEVVVVSIGSVPDPTCNKCPFSSPTNNRCTITGTNDFCGPNFFYVTPDKYALMRLKGEL